MLNFNLFQIYTTFIFGDSPVVPTYDLKWVEQKIWLINIEDEIAFRLPNGIAVEILKCFCTVALSIRILKYGFNKENKFTFFFFFHHLRINCKISPPPPLLLSLKQKFILHPVTTFNEEWILQLNNIIKLTKKSKDVCKCERQTGSHKNFSTSSKSVKNVCYKLNFWHEMRPG